MFTRNYAEGKAAILVRDHNHYKKVGYEAAAKDYKTALDNLIFVAARQGWKITYTVSENGLITLQ